MFFFEVFLKNKLFFQLRFPSVDGHYKMKHIFLTLSTHESEMFSWFLKTFLELREADPKFQVAKMTISNILFYHHFFEFQNPTGREPLQVWTPFLKADLHILIRNILSLQKAGFEQTSEKGSQIYTSCLQPAILLKKTLTQVFPCEFCKNLRIPF